MVDFPFRTLMTVPTPTGPANPVRNDDARLSRVLPLGLVTLASSGAVGNDTADDTSALTSAINAVPPGGTLIFDANRTYRITAALPSPDFVTIDLNGSHIHQVTPNADGFARVDGAYMSIRNGTIRGPVSGSPSGTGTGIRWTRNSLAATVKVSLDNLVIHSFGQDGIELGNGITSSFSLVECRTNGRYGFNIHGITGGAAGTSCHFSACYANGNTGVGWRIENMTYMQFSACAADSNGRQWHILNCQGVSMHGCGSEYPEAKGGFSGDAFVIDGGYGIVMDGCWTYESLTTSLWVTGSAKAVTVTGFTENTPQAPATHSIRTDVNTTVTLIHISNTRPLNLTAGTTLILNDGGGLSLPGYIYGASTAYFEGEVSTSDTTPSTDNTLVPRGWVNAQLADRVPLARVTGGGEWDRMVYGDIVSTGHRDDATVAMAQSATIRTLMLLLGRVPAGTAITGFRMARTIAAAGGAASAALYSSSTLGGTSWTRMGAGNVTPVLTTTGVISTALAVTAQPTDLWYALVFALPTAPTTYPTWSASPVFPSATAALAGQGNGVVVTGYSNAATAPAATLNPTTGWTVNVQKPWAALY